MEKPVFSSESRPGIKFHESIKKEMHEEYKKIWRKYALVELRKGKAAEEILNRENPKGLLNPRIRSEEIIFSADFFNKDDFDKLEKEAVVEAEKSFESQKKC